MTNLSIQCPIDNQVINENRVRWTAFFIFSAAVLYTFTHWLAVPILLLLDFAARAFSYEKYSIVGNLSKKIVVWLQISEKPIGKAPKQFAAKIGFGLIFLILIFIALAWTTAAYTLLTLLLLFSFLEFSIGFCAGCLAYSIYLKLIN